ncbi:unnamed protein product [Thelazia callipaeda]|uniref:ZM domain-containing protein n=1 Tax=Thelazia callipaeda TaxID=103827 RepID=A0A0N5CS40_THECL|nr:unnamed protein product [Thelazia callipaeda]
MRLYHRQSSKSVNCVLWLLLKDNEKRSESLSILDQIHQLIQLANTLNKNSSKLQNPTSLNKRRSLSCSDSDDVQTDLREAFQSKKKSLQPKNISLSSKSSSGVSSVDLIKNFEKVEKWRKNSSKFLKMHGKDDISESEDSSNSAFEEHKLRNVKNWSSNESLPEVCNTFTNQESPARDLSSKQDTTDDLSSTKLYQNSNSHSIRILENEDMTMHESLDRTSDVKIKMENGQFMEPRSSLELGSKPKKTKIFCSKTMLPFSGDQKNQKNQKQQYLQSHTDNSSKYEEQIEKLGTMVYQKSIPRYQIMTDNKAEMICKKYRDHSGDTRTYTNEQRVDVIRNAINDDYNSKSDTTGRSHEINYAVEKNPRNMTERRTEEDPRDVAERRACPSVSNNVEKTRMPFSGSSDSICMENYQKYYVQDTDGFQLKISGTSQYSPVPSTTKTKKNNLKSMFILPVKMVKNVSKSSNSAQKSSYKSKSSQNLAPDQMRREEMNTSKEYSDIIHKGSIVHAIPIVKQNQPPTLLTSTPKKISTKQSTQEKDHHRSDIFMNPIYSDSGARITGFRHPVMPVQYWHQQVFNRRSHYIAPDVASYHSNKMMSLHPLNPENNRYSRKAIRRFY